MAVAIVDVLRRHERIDEDRLADAFAGRFSADPFRGYGLGAIDILTAIRAGQPWDLVAGAAFGGKGSMGNGSAMRVAPLGAYFADDETQLIEEARRSAVVTHANPDGQAGRSPSRQPPGGPPAAEASPKSCSAWFWRRPRRGPTRALVEKVCGLAPESEPLSVALEVGAGWNVLCADTVPFCLWAFARHLNSFEEALWTTVSVPGDRDTNCAIVGGLMAALTGVEGIPEDWRAAREPLRHDADLSPS